MSKVVKYWLCRFLGHALVVVPVICETLIALPYRDAGLLDRLKITGSALVVIAVVIFTLLKNVLKERLKTPAPWMVACTCFLLTAAAKVLSDKLFYITLAWALGSLAALIPYSIANKIKGGKP